MVDGAGRAPRRAFPVHLCNGWILLIGLDELELLDESRYWSLNSILYI
jgi:hypothetical protein